MRNGVAGLAIHETRYVGPCARNRRIRTLYESRTRSIWRRLSGSVGVVDTLRLDPQVFERAELDRVASQLDTGAAVTLPARLSVVLASVVAELRAGHPVTVLPLDTELTSSDSADLLNVSRPHLVSLLERGDIPFRKVGSHHRVLAADVLAYKEKCSAQRRQARSELVNDLIDDTEY